MLLVKKKKRTFTDTFVNELTSSNCLFADGDGSSEQMSWTYWIYFKKERKKNE